MATKKEFSLSVIVALIGILAGIVGICVAVADFSYYNGENDGRYSEIKKLYENQLQYVIDEKNNAVSEIRKAKANPFIQAGVWAAANDVDLRTELARPGVRRKSWRVDFPKEFSGKPIVILGISRLGFDNLDENNKFDINVKVLTNSVTNDSFMIEVIKNGKASLQDLNVNWTAYLQLN